MKKWIVAGTVAVLAGLSLAFAGYQRSGFHMGQGFGAAHGRFMSQRILALLDNDQFRAKVNLTDDQVNRLRQIVIDAEKSAIETRAQMAVDGIELREMLHADKPDQDAVMKKVDQIAQLRGQMMKDGIQAILKAKTVLTPQQQQQVRQFMESRFSRGAWGAHWKDYRGGGRMSPQGPRHGPPSPAQPQQ